MRGDFSKLLGGAVVFIGLLLIPACGGLELGEVEVKPLKVVGLYPQTGEEVSAQDLMVVVVFSESVDFDEVATSVNGETFYLEEDQGGNRVEGGTVEKSEPDPQGATALLSFPDPSPLVSGNTYWVVLKGSIQGTDQNGKDTHPLGEDIRSHFVIE